MTYESASPSSGGKMMTARAVLRADDFPDPSGQSETGAANDFVFAGFANPVTHRFFHFDFVFIGQNGNDAAFWFSLATTISGMMVKICGDQT